MNSRGAGLLITLLSTVSVGALPEASETAGAVRCGPFTSAAFNEEVDLLKGRLHVQFAAQTWATPSIAAAHRAIRLRGHELRVGARETWSSAGPTFETEAERLAHFGGDYEPTSITTREGVRLIAGLIRALPNDQEPMVALAHGWLPDAAGEVIDVAIFISRGAVTDLTSCRALAVKVLRSVRLGERQVTYSAEATAQRTFESERAAVTLPTGWLFLNDNIGQCSEGPKVFLKRATFPQLPVEVSLTRDRIDRQWLEGVQRQRRIGSFLNETVLWHLTEDTAPHVFNAWAEVLSEHFADTVSVRVISDSQTGREEGVRLAETFVRLPEPRFKHESY